MLWLTVFVLTALGNPVQSPGRVHPVSRPRSDLEALERILREVEERLERKEGSSKSPKLYIKLAEVDETGVAEAPMAPDFDWTESECLKNTEGLPKNSPQVWSPRETCSFRSRKEKEEGSFVKFGGPLQNILSAGGKEPMAFEFNKLTRQWKNDEPKYDASGKAVPSAVLDRSQSFTTQLEKLPWPKQQVWTGWHEPRKLTFLVRGRITIESPSSDNPADLSIDLVIGQDTYSTAWGRKQYWWIGTEKGGKGEECKRRTPGGDVPGYLECDAKKLGLKGIYDEDEAPAAGPWPFYIKPGTYKQEIVFEVPKTTWKNLSDDQKLAPQPERMESMCFDCDDGEGMKSTVDEDRRSLIRAIRDLTYGFGF